MEEEWGNLRRPGDGGPSCSPWQMGRRGACLGLQLAPMGEEGWGILQCPGDEDPKRFPRPKGRRGACLMLGGAATEEEGSNLQRP